MLETSKGLLGFLPPEKESSRMAYANLNMTGRLFFTFIDIFKHLEGSDTADKIKMSLRNFYRPRPSGFASAIGFGESRRPRSVKTPSENPLILPYYSKYVMPLSTRSPI